MKNLRLQMLCICITLLNLCAGAQESYFLAPKQDLKKPKIFTNLPERIKVDMLQLNALIERQTGNTTSVSATTDDRAVQFDGNILFSVSDPQSKLKSVMLNLPAFNGARFTLTQLTNDDGTKEYAGRILSFQHGDAYQLEKQGDVYFLIKKSFYDLVNQ